jgi:hypothetical protein
LSLTPLDSDIIENVFLKFYSYDAISLLVDILDYVSKGFNKQLVKYHTEEERQLQYKKILILKFEIIAKVCHYIENFGAFAYSISKQCPDINLITEAYRVISDYDVNAVKSFYDCFITRNSSDNRNLLNLKRIFCYPDLTSADHSLFSQLSETLQNLGDIIRGVGGYYIDKKLKLREAYNSYKHG